MTVELWKRVAVALACGAVAVGCSDDGDTASRSCTVQQNSDGSATIRCADGTSVTLRNGMNGTSGTTCTVGSEDGGMRVISCSDGTRVSIPPGRDGVTCSV